MSVVGPQTYRRAHVYLSGSVHVFNILFQPTGLNRLIGTNMRSLVNQDPAASDVLGKSAVILGDAVRAAPDTKADRADNAGTLVRHGTSEVRIGNIYHRVERMR